MSKLDQLKKMSVIVADTGEIDAIKQYQPIDATTNPSLLYKAAQLPDYHGYLKQAIEWAKSTNASSNELINHASDKFSVILGKEILNYVPGRVSTEVDARLSFDTKATIERARKLIHLYEQEGISSERILIKIAATWEGIQAAKILEQENIQCNLTLLFSFIQAVACADAGVFLISPFVGRILDWYKANTDQKLYAPSEDPGVKSVTKIYNYFKQHNYHTTVMAASFRSTEQILALAGCDRLTISPQLLDELKSTEGDVKCLLQSDQITLPQEKIDHSESIFRWESNEDAMATDKLSEGIRNFTHDQRQLEFLLKTIANQL